MGIELNRIQTFKVPDKREWKVKLGNKEVGKIVQVAADAINETGFRYVPKGQKYGGDLYPSLGACIDSLRN